MALTNRVEVIEEIIYETAPRGTQNGSVVSLFKNPDTCSSSVFFPRVLTESASIRPTLITSKDRVEPVTHITNAALRDSLEKRGMKFPERGHFDNSGIEPAHLIIISALGFEALRSSDIRITEKIKEVLGVDEPQDERYATLLLSTTEIQFVLPTFISRLGSGERTQPTL